jgi:hypothetical protein
VHCSVSVARNAVALFFILGWTWSNFDEKRVRTHYDELVFLHSAGSAAHIVHSIASEARNVDALFFMPRWDRYGFDKKRTWTRDAELVFLHPVGPAGHVVHSGAFGCDVDINTSNTLTPTHNQISSPITRVLVHQLNNQVSSFLASFSSYLNNGNMHSILLLRNDGQEGNRLAFALATFRFQNSSKLCWPPRPSMDLDSGVEILSRNLLESTFMCIRAQVHILLELASIMILVQSPFSAIGAVTPYFDPLDRV